MLRVLAYNHYVTFSFYDLALVANLFNGWFYFHCLSPFLSEFGYLERHVIRPFVRS